MKNGTLFLFCSSLVSFMYIEVIIKKDIFFKIVGATAGCIKLPSFSERNVRKADFDPQNKYWLDSQSRPKYSKIVMTEIMVFATLFYSNFLQLRPSLFKPPIPIYSPPFSPVKSSSALKKNSITFAEATTHPPIQSVSPIYSSALSTTPSSLSVTAPPQLYKAVTSFQPKQQVFSFP